MATVEEFKVKVNVDGADKLDKLGSSASNAAGKMTGLATAILGVGFGAFIHSAAQAADTMADLSDATDITLGSIIAFGGALEAAGGKSRNTEKTILALYNAIELAADGGGKQQEAFAKLGISLDDLRTMSEADILNKTIEGLSKMTGGSERSAIAATLLSKSFRSVDPNKFADELANLKASADESAKGQQSLADFNQKLEKTYRDLQLAAGEVLGPILDVFNGISESSGSAKTAVIAFAGVTALVFGATVISSIKEFISLYQGIAKVIRSAAVAQTALVALTGPAGWAVIAGAAVAATAAYVALDKAMGDAAETAKTAPTAPSGGKVGGVESKNTGPVKRQVKAYISPEAQAAADSEKRILTSQAEWRKVSEMSVTDEIKNIRLGAIAEIEKMEIEVNKNKLLTATQKEKEIAERRKEINAKADFDILKVRAEVEKSMADQLNAINLTTQEKQAQFELEKQMLGLSGAAAEKAKLLLDIETQRKKAIEDAAKVKNADPGDLAKQIEAINAQFEQQKKIAEGQVEFQRSFETGWAKAFNNYVDNATNAAKQADAMFQSLTSNMNNAIDKFVETGKFSFSDFASSVIKDILKIQLRAAAANLFSAGASFLGFTLPGKAIGGPVTAGNPYMVGERGPEMFIPAQAGTIVPNNKLSNGSGNSGNTYITNNISAIDSKSVAQLFAENRQTLFGNVEQARRELPMRTR